MVLHFSQSICFSQWEQHFWNGTRRCLEAQPGFRTPTGGQNRGLGGSSWAHLLRLVPLLGLGWQVLGLRRQVRRLWLLVVVRLLALLAVTAHTLLSILRWHLSKSRAKKARKSKSAIIWFPFSNMKWVLCQATEFNIFNIVSLTKTDALPSVHILSIKSKDKVPLL